MDPRAHLEEEDHEGETGWRRNYATLRPLLKEVNDVLANQTRRGMLIRLPEAEARAKYPHLVVVSLGANRKDRPNGEVTATVLLLSLHSLCLSFGFTYLFGELWLRTFFGVLRRWALVVRRTSPEGNDGVGSFHDEIEVVMTPERALGC